MKIRHQFTILFGLISLVPLVLYGLFAFSHGASHLREDAETALTGLCDRATTRVELWHEERLHDGATFVRSVPLVEYLQRPTISRLQRLQRRLAHFAAQPTTHYLRVYLVDPVSGTVIASSRDTDQGHRAPIPFGQNSWSSGTRGLQLLPRGGSSSHVLANLTLDVVLPPKVKRPAVLVAEVDFTREMNTLLDKLPRGRSGKIILATAQDALVTIGAAQATDLPWRGVGARAARQGVDGQAGVLQGVDRAGAPVVLAYRPLPLLGAALIAKQMLTEVNRPVWALGAALLITLGLSVALTLAVGMWLSRRVTRSTESVAAAARQLAAGDLSVRVEVAGAEELRATSEAFNRMVSEVAKSTAAQKAARQQAEQANADKDRFIAVVSHELRNPLSSIHMGAELLQRSDISPAQRKQAAEVISRNCRLLGRLVNDLLDLSRLTHGRMQFEMAPVSLDALVRDACQTHQRAAGGKGAPIRVHVDANLCVHADAERLQQVVLNLLGNARKFTPADGEITVEVQRAHPLNSAEPVARIAVSDTGVGIAPAALSQLFDLFVQGSEQRAGKQGLGIGLALVKGIVQAHRGRVWAESDGLGCGSRFVVELPLMTQPKRQAGRQMLQGVDQPRA